MERLKNSKIIVTGGTGFIGSHLVQQLLQKGAQVAVVDIQLQENSYFAEQKLDKEATIHIIDIAEKEKIETLYKDLQPDYVFHLAAEAIVNDSYENPYRTFQTNVMGTVSILEASRKTDSVKGTIVASSDKAYGKTEKTYTENFPLKGDHPYDVSKTCTDLIAQTYFKSYNLPITVTRFGNVYGEGDLHISRIIPGISVAVNKQSLLDIRSDGTYVRDYLYVKDVAEGYIFLLENIDKAKGEAFNFSSADKLSVLELIHQAEKILGKKINYKILNTAKNEIPYQHLDDSKVRALGWKNKYSMNEVLPHIVDWYKKIVT